jgi:hypothetical protein
MSGFYHFRSLDPASSTRLTPKSRARSIQDLDSILIACADAYE